jgi:hypothetical protein
MPICTFSLLFFFFEIQPSNKPNQRKNEGNKEWGVNPSMNITPFGVSGD